MRQATRALCLVSRRTFASTAAADVAVTLGARVTSEEIAKAARVPASCATEVITPVESAWMALNTVARRKLCPYTLNIGQEILGLRAQVAAKPPAQPHKDALKTFKTSPPSHGMELFRFYEEVMYPIRSLKREFDVLELEMFTLQDHLRLGLSKFKQEQLNEKEKQLKEVQERMATNVEARRLIVVESFDTLVFNDLINILRMAGEKSEPARRMAIRVLEDMTLCGVPFDETTKLMLKNVTFDDGPYDDSGLLFLMVKYPERGEISVSRKPLEALAGDSLKVVSNRHSVPITPGQPLQSTETHPMLQRSVE